MGGGGGGRKEGGMRIENVYRIRKAELGQSVVVGWRVRGGTRQTASCDQKYVKSHIGFFLPGLIQRLHCDKNASNSTGKRASSQRAGSHNLPALTVFFFFFLQSFLIC